MAIITIVVRSTEIAITTMIFVQGTFRGLVFCVWAGRALVFRVSAGAGDGVVLRVSRAGDAPSQIKQINNTFSTFIKRVTLNTFI